MRVERVDVYEVPMRLLTPFVTSADRSDVLHHHLVRLRCGDVEGWGECAAPGDPSYAGDTSATSWETIVRSLLPLAIGSEWTDVAGFERRLGSVRGNTFARAAFDAAAWDVAARVAGLSLATALGAERTSIPAGVALGIAPDRAALLERVDECVRDGYARVKLKIAPGHDVGVVAAVRERYPELALAVDANGAYSLDDISTLRELDRFSLSYIEQPLGFCDFVEHAELAREIATPICLDESVRSLADVRTALALGSARVINLKAGRVGGLSEALRIVRLCRDAGIDVWIGGMHEYGVGRAAAVALAALPGVTLPGDLSPSAKYYARDLIDPPIVMAGGRIAVPTGPGLGVGVDVGRVEALATRHAGASSSGFDLDGA